MARLRIKICGITSEADAQRAVDLGADAIGLNFYERSPRFVRAETASGIVRLLPPFVEPVGLFVNEPWPEVFRRAQSFPALRTVQWHGDRPEPCPPSAYRCIPAFQVRDRQGLDEVSRYLDRCHALDQLPAAVLVDGHLAGEYGGTGQPAPWRLLADFRPGVPLILAGGLTPDNVAEAVRIVRPYAVDVASGVESSPGRKDPEKMRRFIDTVRQMGD
jgi:phosphoribosylanthranilate isomerase